MNKNDILAFLKLNGVAFEYAEHKPLFTMQDLFEVGLQHMDAEAKNLFVRDDKKQNYYLISVKGDKCVDLKEFRKKYNTRSLSFASKEELFDFLQLTPGSVSPFGLLNDNTKRVIFCIDQDFLTNDSLIGCHPNENTATVWLKTSNLIKIVENHGNKVLLVEI